MEKIEIGLQDNNREAVISDLCEILANQHVLYMKLRNFHWNLVGDRFRSLHAFFEEQYEGLATVIDETAERIRMLGGVAPGSMKQLLEHATLSETDSRLIDGDVAVKTLVTDHETCVRDLRTAIRDIEENKGDVGTADFLTGLIQKHEEAAWMLRSLAR